MKNLESVIKNCHGCFAIILLFIIVSLSKSSISQSANPNTSPQSAPTETEEIIHVDSDLVMLPVTVMDRDGRYIAGLDKGDFSIYEDGREQDVVFFETFNTPITVFFVLDTSSSMKRFMLELSDAANLFLGKLQNDDRIIAARFCKDFIILQNLTPVKNIRGRKSLVLRQCSSRSGTRLYDAVHQAIRKIRKVSGRKAIVLFSDGEDTGVSVQNPVEFVTKEDNYKSAMEGDFLVYTLQFKDDSRTSFPCELNDNRCIEAYESPTKYMENMAKITGGRHLRINEITDLSNAFRTIADELKQQYSLGYYPKNKGKEGERREIRVRVNRPGLAVRARDSYVVGKRKSK